MRYLKAFPFYTFLLALFFCLHGLLENYGSVSFKDVLSVLWKLTAAIIAVYLFVLLLSKSKLYAGFVTFLLASIYLFFGAIKPVLSIVPFLKTYTILVPFLFVSVTAVITIVRHKKVFLSKTTLYLNILFIVYCIFDLVLLSVKRTTPPSNYLSPVKLAPAQIRNKADVYFLLLDEYAGYESLRDSFGFENNSFIGELNSIGFEVLPTFSNYSRTYFSMSSILNMNYLTDIKDSSQVGVVEMQRRNEEIRNASIFTFFRDAGYDVRSYSLFEVAGNERIKADRFLLQHERLLTNKMFHNILLKDVGWNFTSGKFAHPALQKFMLGDKPVYNGKVEAGLLNSLQKNEKPKFVYCHFFMPHAPFFYDSLGRERPLADHYNLDFEFIKQSYLSYLKYCNKKIIAYTKAIIKNNPTAIIILLSDHGFRDDKWAIPLAAFDNFCAIKWQSEDSLLTNAKISNVNIFRHVLKKEFNQSIPYLIDRKVLIR